MDAEPVTVNSDADSDADSDEDVPDLLYFDTMPYIISPLMPTDITFLGIRLQRRNHA